MISINSLQTWKIKKAKTDFVNHVYGRVFYRIPSNLRNGHNHPEELDLKIINLYSESEEIDFGSISLDVLNDVMSFILERLYNIISSSVEEIIEIDKEFKNFIFEKNPRIRALLKLIKTKETHKKTVDLKRKKIFPIKIGEYKKVVDGYKNKGSYLRVKKEYEEIISIINQVFNYDDLTKGYPQNRYSLYDLGESLGLRTCPYCNKNYIFTIRDENNSSRKLVNATFDHWLSQSEYPLLQLSFYNLIPSCYNCNSNIKKAKHFSIDTHVHPYTVAKDITEKYNFNYYENKDKKTIVYIDYSVTNHKLTKKLKRTFSDFKTEKIYGAQMLEIEEMRELAEAYHENYIESLLNLFPESNLTKEKINNLLFHTSELDKNHHLRPLSKFRLDILKKLEVI